MKTRAIAYDTSWARLLWLALFAGTAALILAGCDMGGAIGGYPDENGGGTDVTVTSASSSGSLGLGTRAIVIGFSSPIPADISVNKAGIPADRQKIEDGISVKDANGDDVAISSMIWSADGGYLRLHAPLQYCATYTVELTDSDGSVTSEQVTMGQNPYDFDRSDACTSDYPFVYNISNGPTNVYVQVVLSGEFIAASEGIPMDYYNFEDLAWNFPSIDYNLSWDDRLRNVDGAGTAGLSGKISYEMFKLGLVWTEYSMDDETPQTAVLPTGSDVIDTINVCELNSVRDIGDVDGDGVNDVAFNEMCAYSKETQYFLTSIVKGPMIHSPPGDALNISVIAPEQGLVGLLAEKAWDNMVYMGKGPADVNADGLGDLLVATTDAEIEDLGGGKGCLASDPLRPCFLNSSHILVYTGLADIKKMLDAPSIMITLGEEWRMFTSVMAADVNGDGISDIVATDSKVVDGDPPTLPVRNPLDVRTYIFFGRADWPDGLTAADADVVIKKWYPAGFVRPINGGDLNADGFEDILLFSSYDSGAESVVKDFIIYGKAVWAESYVLERDYDVMIEGDADYKLGSFSSIIVGDLGNDGYDDLIISAKDLATDKYNLYVFMGGALPERLKFEDAYTHIVLRYDAP